MPEPPLPPFVARLSAVDPRDKRALVEANRERLEQDLWSGALRFSSLPSIVDVQFSNFCNMACTMCYPQGNPPLQKMPDEVLEKVVRATFETASTLVPFAGSEPLVFTWDLTRKLAELFGLELDVVTNVQFLDEKKFAELEPLVTSIRFSIDSHLRDVYAKIRLKSKPDQVFRNLATAARLCREHGIEVQTNIVFMAENALHLDETIRALADLGIPTFHVLQYHYVGPDGAASDPYLKIPAAEMEAVFARVRALARERRLCVVFDLREKEIHDHRPDDLALRKSPKNDAWIERFRRHFPGYCLQSFNRIKVNADGAVYPCCVADREQLNLGNLRERDFDAIWNGPESRDLRRAMVTQDLPALCRDCSFTRGWILPPQPWLPFIDAATRESLSFPATSLEVDPAIVLAAPDHVTRTESAPTLAWSHSGPPPSSWLVPLALGGEAHRMNLVLETSGDVTSVTPDAALWRELRSNVAFWWTAFAVDRDASGSAIRVRRAADCRCVVRHEAIARVEGSTLYGNAAQPMFRFSGATTTGSAARSAGAGG